MQLLFVCSSKSRNPNMDTIESLNKVAHQRDKERKSSPSPADFSPAHPEQSSTFHLAEFGPLNSKALPVSDKRILSDWPRTGNIWGPYGFEQSFGVVCRQNGEFSSLFYHIKFERYIQHEGTPRDGMGISSDPYFCISLTPKPLKQK